MNSNTSQKTIVVSGQNLTLEDLVQVAIENTPLDISKEALKRVDSSRQCVESRLQSGETFYGINTGFGALANVSIPKERLSDLQYNLIRSHACGVGAPLPCEMVRAILVLRIQNILRGNSGARREVVLIMKEFLNKKITPHVPAKGSVGASGDLAPLAHIALCLIGEGQVFYEDKLVPTQDVLKKLQIKPLTLEAKEGLCLINGTQVMTAVGLISCVEALNLLKTADIAAATSLDAFRGTLTAFRPEIQAVRPHTGQAVVAENVCKMLQNDAILESHKDCGKVQDPYSFRCVPQVHGASRNVFDHVLQTLLVEANSSTDNPLIFEETNEILSGGNFHGQIVALVLDYLAMGMSEIANIAERRLEKLTNPHFSRLPPFLTRDSGVCSGFMIPHVTVAALVNENKVLSTPASVDSLPTSAEKEDHVSMGMTSANKLRVILQNVAHVLAIELLAGVEGVEFHEPLKPSIGVQATCAWVRKRAAPIKDQDRVLAPDIELVASHIKSGQLVQHVESALKQSLF